MKTKALKKVLLCSIFSPTLSIACISLEEVADGVGQDLVIPKFPGSKNTNEQPDFHLILNYIY